MKSLLEELKELEFRGYEFEAADASLKLLIAKCLGRRPTFFVVEGYRVIVERRGADLVAEATVKLKVDGQPFNTVAECTAGRRPRQGAAPRAGEKLPPARDADPARLQGAHPGQRRGHGCAHPGADRERRRPRDLGHGWRERQHH